MLPDGGITELFWGVIESTEEAIINAMIAAETMTGRDGDHGARPAARRPRRDHDPVRPRPRLSPSDRDRWPLRRRDPRG